MPSQPSRFSEHRNDKSCSLVGYLILTRGKKDWQVIFAPEDFPYGYEWVDVFQFSLHRRGRLML